MGSLFFGKNAEIKLNTSDVLRYLRGRDIIKSVNTSDVRCNKRKCGPAEREKTEEIGLAR